MDQLIKQIKRLKKEKNAVILAHNYQVLDVQEIADFIGDSLELSRLAAKVENDVIVFAGVRFMAETAKILSPQKKVLLPRIDAGCPMADMITVDELRSLKQKYPQAKVLTYVNSSVEIKAESDVCCTSANAVKVAKSLDTDQIIFIPDQNLGHYVKKHVPDKQFIIFNGFCFVHHRISREEIEQMRKKFPDARVIVHPEVRMEVIDIADEVFSTSGMIRYVADAPYKQFIIGTEQGLIDRMKKENPQKEFYPACRPKICVNMKKTSLLDIYKSLVEDKYEINIPSELACKALAVLNEMLKYV